jgi:hypothetical protein
MRSMRLRSRAHVIPPTVIVLALVASLGPHLLMLGYHLAGAAPPSELLLLCPLHHGGSVHTATSWTLHAKPLA